MKRRVQLFNQNRGIEIETEATDGAIVGVNLRWQDGSLVAPEDLAPGQDQADDQTAFWRLLQEIPESVTALENVTGTGLYAITGDGDSATREIQGRDGEVVVENGSGVDGDPIIGLAEIEPGAGGQLQLTAFDEHGRRTHEGAPSTDDLPEGADALYFTPERAVAALEAVGAIIPATGPSDGDIPEYDANTGEWIPTREPRVLYLDGGNF